MAMRNLGSAWRRSLDNARSVITRQGVPDHPMLYDAFGNPNYNPFGRCLCLSDGESRVSGNSHDRLGCDSLDCAERPSDPRGDDRARAIFHCLIEGERGNVLFRVPFIQGLLVCYISAFSRIPIPTKFTK